MKKMTVCASPEQTVADLTHLAWCALVALRLAQREGMSVSPLTTHTFLLRWLAGAQKQKRFPRSVAPDIESLVLLGRHKGPSTNLEDRLKSLWDACTGPLLEQSDLFRLTYAIEQVKGLGWMNIVVSDKDWVPEALRAEYSDVSALLVKKSDLFSHFSPDGTLLLTLEFLVMGEAMVFMQALERHRLNSIALQQEMGWSWIGLQPENPG